MSCDRSDAGLTPARVVPLSTSAPRASPTGFPGLRWGPLGPFPSSLLWEFSLPPCTQGRCLAPAPELPGQQGPSPHQAIPCRGRGPQGSSHPLLSGASGSEIEKILEDSIRAPGRPKAVDTQLPGMLVKAPRSPSGVRPPGQVWGVQPLLAPLCSRQASQCPPGPLLSWPPASPPEAPEKSYAPSWKTFEPRRGGPRQRWPRLVGGSKTSR